MNLYTQAPHINTFNEFNIFFRLRDKEIDNPLFTHYKTIEKKKRGGETHLRSPSSRKEDQGGEICRPCLVIMNSSDNFMNSPNN